MTSLHPRIINSFTVRMSSIRRFISLSLSLNPAKIKRPVGCNAMLMTSSSNSLYKSSELKLNIFIIHYEKHTTNKFYPL